MLSITRLSWPINLAIMSILALGMSLMLYSLVIKGNNTPGKTGPQGDKGDTGACNLTDPNQLFIAGNTTFTGVLEINGTAELNSDLSLFDMCSIKNVNTSNTTSCVTLGCESGVPFCLDIPGGINITNSLLSFMFDNITMDGDYFDFGDTVVNINSISGNISIGGTLSLPLILGDNSQTLLREDPANNTFLQIVDPQGLKITTGLLILDTDIFITAPHKFLTQLDLPLGLRIQNVTITKCTTNPLSDLCIVVPSDFKINSKTTEIGVDSTQLLKINANLTGTVFIDSGGIFNFDRLGSIFSSGSSLIIQRNTSNTNSFVKIIDNLSLENGLLLLKSKNVSFDPGSFISSNLHVTTGNVLIDQNLTVLGTTSFNNLNIINNMTVGQYLFANNANITNRLYADYINAATVLESDGNLQVKGGAFFQATSSVLFTGTTTLGSPLYCTNLWIQPNTPLTPNPMPCIAECPEQIRCQSNFRSINIYDRLTVGGIIPPMYNITYSQSLLVQLGSTANLINSLAVGTVTEVRFINATSNESGGAITSLWREKNVGSVAALNLNKTGTSGTGYIASPPACILTNNPMNNTCTKVDYYYDWANQTTVNSGETFNGVSETIRECDPLLPLCFPYLSQFVPPIDYVTMMRSPTKQVISPLVYTTLFINSTTIVTNSTYFINGTEYSYIYQNGPLGFIEIDFGNVMSMGIGFRNDSDPTVPIQYILDYSNNTNSSNVVNTINDTFVLVDKNTENIIMRTTGGVNILSNNTIITSDILEAPGVIHRCCGGSNNRRAYYSLTIAQSTVLNQQLLLYVNQFINNDPGGEISNSLSGGVFTVPRNGTYSFSPTLVYDDYLGDVSTFRGITMVVISCTDLNTVTNGGFTSTAPFPSTSIKVQATFVTYLHTPCQVFFRAWHDSVPAIPTDSTSIPQENKLEIVLL